MVPSEEFSVGPRATVADDKRAFGALRSVDLPDGRRVEYVLDGRHRRVGRRLDGALTHGWLYDGALRIVAELDGAGAVRSRFIYGERPNVPEAMVRDGRLYRILTDHLGSLRAVVDASDGTVAQRMDHDAWGNVRADTNPGFVPFGFAGGLYDAATGLVRFGARDYDPAVGRWTAKDPIGFGGGDANVYAYVASTPVSSIDPTGLDAFTFSLNFTNEFNYGMGASNDFFFGGISKFTRTGLGFLTSGAVARTVGTVTPIQAGKALLCPGLGPRGVATLGVARTFGAAGLNMLVNGAAGAISLETGIVIGSAYNALGIATAEEW